MARTKTVIVNDVEYQLQSVNFTWYSNLTDLYINPANGRKNTAKYADALIKGCVTAPAEVAKAGLKYFDEQDDLATPGELVREIESFLSLKKWICMSSPRPNRPACSGRTNGTRKIERRDELWMKPAVYRTA